MNGRETKIKTNKQTQNNAWKGAREVPGVTQVSAGVRFMMNRAGAEDLSGL